MVSNMSAPNTSDRPFRRKKPGFAAVRGMPLSPGGTPISALIERRASLAAIPDSLGLSMSG
jgi:hypothetical protein